MQNGEVPGANVRALPQELLTAVSNPLLRNSLKRCHDAGNGDCDFFHNLCPNLMPPHPNCQPSFFRSTVALTAPPAKTVPPPQVWGRPSRGLHLHGRRGTTASKRHQRLPDFSATADNRQLQTVPTVAFLNDQTVRIARPVLRQTFSTRLTMTSRLTIGQLGWTEAVRRELRFAELRHRPETDRRDRRGQRLPPAEEGT